MFTVGESPPNIWGKWKRTANSTIACVQTSPTSFVPRATKEIGDVCTQANSTTGDSTSGWKSSPGKINEQNSTRARTSTLNSARATAQRRQTLSTRDSSGYTATTNMLSSNKILQLHCKRSWRREGTPTAKCGQYNSQRNWCGEASLQSKLSSSMQR